MNDAKKDMELTFMDALLYAMEGKDPSAAIENQERRGQQSVVMNKRLPRKGRIRSAEEFDAREQYEKMGIEVLGEYDDLFYDVKLPDGWEIKATSHSMWNELRDDKGRLRAKFFYKAAFYDRDAFIGFETRYTVNANHVAPYEDNYVEWRKSDLRGAVYDAGTVIYETESVPAPFDDHGEYDFRKDERIVSRLIKEAEQYCKKHFPDYQDVNAYWD